MAITLAVVARNANVIRYRVTQDGEGSSPLDYPISSIRSDLAFDGSPLDQVLAQAEEATDTSTLVKLVLGTGIPGDPLEAPMAHAVGHTLRQISLVAAALQYTTTIISSVNYLELNSTPETEAEWIIEIRIDHTFVQ